MNRIQLIASLVLGLPLTEGNAEPAEDIIPIGVKSAARIAEVIEEVRSGYGGTLVTAPADLAIDSAAFIERYLSAFEDPVDLGHYDYRFERLLARISQFPQSIEDPRLDEAVWRAYLALESTHPGKTSYLRGDTNFILDSARDLLWTFLGYHAPEIHESNARREWWMSKLLAPGSEIERLARSFAAIHLISAIQDEPPQLVIWDVDPATQIDAGREGLDWFAEQKSLAWTLWGAAPEEIAAPSIDRIHFRRWESKLGIDQESWSKKRSQFHAVSYRPIGRRAQTYSVRLPTELTTDGVFLLFAKERLHVWPKQRFFAGVLSMLTHTGFLEPGQAIDFARELDTEVLEETARSTE